VSKPAAVDDPATELLPTKRDHHKVDQLRLRVTEGADAGITLAATGVRSLIGTHESNDLVLTDPTVSRFHCEIVAGANHARIRDVGSSNGTIVDGVAVVDAHLRHGSRLTLGRTELIVELGAQELSIPISRESSFGRMVGRSSAMRAVFAALDRATRSAATVLLMGETGTGKDIAAGELHARGPRADAPFVVIDCGALPPSLAESELFGHERGAFTGADRARAGAFEAASGGTLFLDEIGELPWDLQPKLLRVLESRQVQRVGSTQRVPVDVRVIAATSRNLWGEVNAKRFRSDLYYRLAVIKIMVPPLRERIEDIPLLVDALTETMGLDEEARARLGSEEMRAETGRHLWPGNVRELRNYLERCAAMQDTLPPQDPDELAPLSIDAKLPLAMARERCLRAFERAYVEALLNDHDGNVTAAARAAGIDRTSMHRLLSRCGVRPRRVAE
jgi:DNA-binding NtrC family response regulator